MLTVAFVGGYDLYFFTNCRPDSPAGGGLAQRRAYGLRIRHAA